MYKMYIILTKYDLTTYELLVINNKNNSKYYDKTEILVVYIVWNVKSRFSRMIVTVST